MSVAVGRDERLHRSLWRLHFYAGLFCIPFILWLAVTGSIYALKPQIDALIDRPYDALATTGPRRDAKAIVRVAVAAVPGSHFNAYELPPGDRAAVRVLVGKGSEIDRVYVDPRSLAILKVIDEDARFERRIFHLHGELLLGDTGSRVVELAASWAIVMVLTGLFLWWPRDARGFGGILYPRGGAGRVFWRDIHAVTGVWVSLFALFFLISGLPWAASWGGILKVVQTSLAGKPVAQHDWTNGSASERERRFASNAAPAGSAMDGMPGMAPPMSLSASTKASEPYDLERMIAGAARLDLAAPVLISPPSGARGTWTARSDAQDRPLRVTAVLDPRTGAVLGTKGFAAQSFVDKIVGIGVAAHEGQLFGILNEMTNIAIAIALSTVSISAIVLWWSRRPKAQLGAPKSLGSPRFAAALIVAVIAVGVLLPFFGVSLVVVWLSDRFIMRRIPPIRRYLGLA